MIYVVASSAFKDNSLSEHMNLIKIGYTDDSIKNIRYGQYKLHNPSVIVLYEIPDCGIDIEDQTNFSQNLDMTCMVESGIIGMKK